MGRCVGGGVSEGREGKVGFPRKREKLVLVLKLSVGDVPGEQPADLLNNSDLVRSRQG